MKIIILGGLSFLGRHLIERGLDRGHEISVFTRGRRNADLYPDVEKLRGDRDGNLAALQGRDWDVAIDTSGYFPRVVRQSAQLLAGAVDHYTFVSSISVYADASRAGLDEGSPLATIDDQTVEEITEETYGALKVLCEQAVEEALPGRTLIVRPGLIVGKYDPTDRFTYWPQRVAQGGEVLAPGNPGDPVQIIDAYDLANWMLDLAAARTVGVYNATGPEHPLGMAEVLEASRTESGSDATFTWVPAEFLEQHGVRAWEHMPAWVPDSDEFRGFNCVDCSRAFASGLTCRPLAETVRDTLEWASTFSSDHEWRAGLPREREREVLGTWHSTANGTA